MYRSDAREDRSLLVVAMRSEVAALDPATGHPRWRHRLESWGDEVELLIGRGRVYATDGVRIACLDYLTGQLIGEAPLDAQHARRPTMVLEGGRLFVAVGQEVLCLDESGRRVWRYFLPAIGSAALGFPGNLRQADDAGR